MFCLETNLNVGGVINAIISCSGPKNKPTFNLYIKTNQKEK